MKVKDLKQAGQFSARIQIGMGTGGGGPKNTDQDANQGGFRWRRS